MSTQFIMLLNAQAEKQRDLSSLRAMFTGGEAVPYERAAEFEETTGAKVLQFNGSNETGALSYTTSTDTRDHRLRTAGRVIEDMKVRLFDPATGADITGQECRGQPGCLGPTLALGYWGDEAANQQLFTADGWMLMGDIVEIDADGYLTVVGRTSDFIIRGGKNISAPAVEDEVGSHPAVAMVAAVAMPDDVFGERVCVYVVPRRDATVTLEDLRDHLSARGVSKEWWPERLEVVDDLPRSSGARSPRATSEPTFGAGSASTANRSHGRGPDLRPPVVDTHRALLLAAHHRRRQHDPERRPALHRAGSRGVAVAAAVDGRRLHHRVRGLLLTAGSLGDRYGRRRALMFGLAWFAVFSALRRLRHLADSSSPRARSWASAARSSTRPPCPSSPTCSTTSRSGPRRSGSGPASPASASPSGLWPVACCVEHFWWGSIFLVNVPICAMARSLCPFFVPTTSDPRSRPRPDRRPAFDRWTGHASLYAIIEVPDQGWTAPIVLGAFGVGAVFIAAFALVGAAHPEHRCSTCASSRTPASRPPRPRSR